MEVLLGRNVLEVNVDGVWSLAGDRLGFILRCEGGWWSVDAILGVRTYYAVRLV